jgi:hypothetical protein
MSAHTNHLAVWIASAIYFVIGGLWYAPFMLGKKWMALTISGAILGAWQ